MAALPTVRCERRIFPKTVTADPRAEHWRGLHICTLRDTLTDAAPKQATAVKVAWDGTELRVLFEITDSHIVGTQTKRDGPLWKEEVAEVFLDPVGDLESYYEFEVNPINTVLDLVIRKNRSGYAKNFTWKCDGWRTATSRIAGGWCVEMAFPIRSLTDDVPSAGTRWRANFYRIDRPVGADRELTAWSPTGRANFHTPERFGFLEFVG